jgi:hypothetical protein
MATNWTDVIEYTEIDTDDWQIPDSQNCWYWNITTEEAGLASKLRCYMDYAFEQGCQVKMALHDATGEVLAWGSGNPTVGTGYIEIDISAFDIEVEEDEDLIIAIQHGPNAALRLGCVAAIGGGYAVCNWSNEDFPLADLTDDGDFAYDAAVGLGIDPLGPVNDGDADWPVYTGTGTRASAESSTTSPIYTGYGVTAGLILGDFYMVADYPIYTCEGQAGPYARSEITYPVYSGAGYTGAIANDQETPKFDVSATAHKQPYGLTQDGMHYPRYTMTGTGTVHLFANGIAESPEWQAISTAYVMVRGNGDTFFPYYFMSAVGHVARFEDYILRYVRGL